MPPFDLEAAAPNGSTTTEPADDDGHRALVRIEPQLAGLSDAELLAINVDIPRACATVTGALPAIRSLRPLIAEHLPKLPLATLDQLGDYTMALYYAHLMTKPRPVSSGTVVAVYKEAVALRTELIEQAGALARKGFFDATKVAAIKAGSGYLDTANDVVALSLMFRQGWSAVSDKTVVTQEDCERADRVGRELLTLVDTGNRSTLDGLTMDQARDRRARCFTLFLRAYDLARQAASHLRWKQGDANDFVPSVFTKPGRRRKPAPQVADGTGRGPDTQEPRPARGPEALRT